MPAIIAMGPELEERRHQLESSPVARTHDDSTGHAFEFSYPRQEIALIRHNTALRRRSGGNLTEKWTLLKVSVGFVCRKPLHLAFNSDLFSEVRPVEHDCCERIIGELPALSALVVREEGKASLTNTAINHHANRWPAVFGSSSHGDNVGIHYRSAFSLF